MKRAGSILKNCDVIAEAAANNTAVDDIVLENVNDGDFKVIVEFIATI